MLLRVGGFGIRIKFEQELEHKLELERRGMVDGLRCFARGTGTNSAWERPHGSGFAGMELDVSHRNGRGSLELSTLAISSRANPVCQEALTLCLGERVLALATLSSYTRSYTNHYDT